MTISLRKATWAKRCSYTGVFVAFLSLNLTFYWGNLSVYTGSYFKRRLGPSAETTAPWLFSCFNIGWAISSILSGYIANVIGWRWTMILACILLDSSLFLSALSVQHSMVSLDLSLGLLSGLTSALVLTTGIQHLMSFRPKYIGSVVAFVLSARNLSGAVENQLITWYINPANLKPDLVDNRQKYFTQKEVLDRVPSVFLLLGFVSLCCHVIGIPLMRPYEKMVENLDDGRGLSVHEREILIETQERAQEAVTSRETKETSTKDETSLTANFTPRQVLKSKVFYVLASQCCSAEYSFTIIANFFKVYGQTWITDDQFLATLATSFLISSLLARPLWGLFADRFDVKSTLMGFACAISLISNFYYFTPMVSQWLYFVWTVMFGCFTNGFHFMVPVATVKLFGTENFSKNYGLLMSSNIVSNFAIAKIIEAIFTASGWFYVFFSVGCSNALGLILILLWIPR